MLELVTCACGSNSPLPSDHAVKCTGRCSCKMHDLYLTQNCVTVDGGGCICATKSFAPREDDGDEEEEKNEARTKEKTQHFLKINKRVIINLLCNSIFS